MDNSYFDLLPIELVTVILFYVDDLLPIIALNYKTTNQILSTKEFFIGKFNLKDIKLKRDSFIYNSLTSDPLANINIYNYVDQLYTKIIRGMFMYPRENLIYENFSKLNIDDKIRDVLLGTFPDVQSYIYSNNEGCTIYMDIRDNPIKILVNFIDGLDFIFKLDYY